MKTRTAIVLSLLVLSTVASAQKASIRPEPQSLIQLISNPERFEGQQVRVVGYVVREFEGDSVYLHREDHEQGLFKNGLWLDDVGKCKDAEGNMLSKKYALVEGVFSALSRGHRNISSGSIKVERCIARSSQ